MENQKFDFENMGIYDLRNYARNIGVISPTKFKREELIQKITAIIMGQEPEKKKTNKGRPPKHKINEQSRLDFILPNNMFDNSDPKYQAFKNQSSLRFGIMDLMCESSNTETTNILYDGYYKPYDVNFGFILKKGYLSNYYKENVIILNEVVEQYNLKEGDYVTGASSYLQNKNLMLVTSVLTINGVNLSATQGNRVMLENSKIVKPKKIINLNNGLIDFTIIDKLCPIVKGTRVLINFEDKDITKNTMINMFNNIIKRNNVNIFLFTIDDLLEEIYEIKDNCPEINLVNYSYNMDRQNYIEMSNLKIKHCLRLAEEGKDVALVLYNTDNYKNNISNNAVISDGLSLDSSKVYAQNKIKDLFCLAKNLEKGSLTTILINSTDNELKDICNTVINFNSSKLADTDITLNVVNSFTRNMQEIVSDTEFKKVKQFKENLTNTNVLIKLEKLFEV